MNKQDQMTMQEAERKMESLREVFQVVRLVDGEMLMDREKRIMQEIYLKRVSVTVSGKKTRNARTVALFWH